MSTYQPGDQTPIRSHSQIAGYFEPRSPVEGRLGVEWELLPVQPDSRLVAYDGPGGVEEALARLAPFHEAIFEADRLTAVKLEGGGMMGLEPGGQVELATLPSERLALIQNALERPLALIERSAASSGFSLAPWGVAPENGEEDLADVPKARYGLLRDHLRTAGTLGRRMMKLTASTQVSLDYRDESELTAMARAAVTAAPYLVAFTANAPVYKGRRTAWATQRPRIWRGTDRRRCGLPAFLFAPKVTYAAAARWALSRPVLFLVRDGKFLPGDARTFAQVLAGPGPLGPVTMEAGDLHVSTLFPDLRLRSYLEIRVLDSLPLPLVMAATAFFKGLLSGAGRRVLSRSGLSCPDRAGASRSLLQAGRLGPRWIPEDGPPAQRAMKLLLHAASRGLGSLGEEPSYLDPLTDLVAANRCPADSWTRRSEGGWIGPGTRWP
jgi:glutamate--cysteine ligase